MPTGSYRNGSNDAVVTPTIAFGKGWHNFDVQTTFGVNVPTADSVHFGHPVLSNTTFQYRVLIGRFPIHNRLGFTVGGGVQIAVTNFHQYNHNWILSLRLPF